MRIRFHEDYYYWCCEWCDTENRVLWVRLDEGVTCGACHKKLQLPQADYIPQNTKLSVALC